MKHFFIQLTPYKARNKAHREIQDFVSPYNRALMDETTLKQFKVALLRKQDEINSSYPRSKPFEVRFSSIQPGNPVEYQSVTVASNFVLSFREIQSYQLSMPVSIP